MKRQKKNTQSAMKLKLPGGMKDCPQCKVRVADRTCCCRRGCEMCLRSVIVCLPLHVVYVLCVCGVCVCVCVVGCVDGLVGGWVDVW